MYCKYVLNAWHARITIVDVDLWVTMMSNFQPPWLPDRGGFRTRLSVSSSSRRQHHLPSTLPRNALRYWGSSFRKRALAAYVPTPSLPDAVAARDHQSAIYRSHSDSSTHQAHHSNYVRYIAFPCGSDANGRGGRSLQGHDRDDDFHGMVRPVMCDVVKRGQTQNRGFWGSPHINRKLKHSES